MSKFLSIEEVVSLPMLGNKDYLKRAKGRMLTWAKYVYDDLNMQVIRQAKREIFHINKRFNYIDIPCDTELSSVNVMDHCGQFWPVFRNDRIHDDLIDIPINKDCNCEFNCSSQLCNTIKGYQAVQSTVTETMPDNSQKNFNIVSRIACDKSGFVYKETQYTERVYTNGVWTGVVVKTKSETLCKCDVDSNGCILTTDQNINIVCNACGITQPFASLPCIGVCPPSCDTPPHGGNAQGFPDPTVNTWIYYCNSKLDWFAFQCGSFHHCHHSLNNIYNINEAGNRILFPRHFGHDKVMLRLYVRPQLKDMKIPFVAVPTFVTGLKWFDKRWDDKEQKLAMKYERDYLDQKIGLFIELNRYRIAEQRMILTPPVHVPSYIEHFRHHGWQEAPLS